MCKEFFCAKNYAALEQHVKRAAFQGGHVWGQPVDVRKAVRNAANPRRLHSSAQPSATVKENAQTECV